MREESYEDERTGFNTKFYRGGSAVSCCAHWRESSSATDSSSTNNSSANDTSKTDNTNTDSSATQSSDSTNTDSSTLPSGDTGSGLDPGSTSASGVNLPKTGPASTLIGTLGASVLVASVVAFVRSRRV